MTPLLIIDSELREWDRYSAFLEGYDLQFCPTGGEGLAAVKAGGFEAKAALVFWELAGPMNGAELLVHIRRTCPALPVIMVCGLLNVNRAARATKMGAHDVLVKPLERNRLVSAVRGALRPPVELPLMPDLQSRLVGKSTAFVSMLETVASVIPHGDVSVLLTGPTGTGKELLARAIHELGEHSSNPLVAVNLAESPATLIESTLFGHERGAFTGAHGTRAGKFEESGRGTLFLDEIGELEPPMQVKLLRTLQERDFHRLGGREILKFEARLVCATNRNLVQDQKNGRFREDLYHRIAVCEIQVPTLRERGDDIWLLADHILKKCAPDRTLRLARETRKLFSEYQFTGNVRELERILKHALVKCQGEEILPAHLPLESMAGRLSETDEAARPETSPWPEEWMNLAHKSAMAEVERAFNRVYLPRKLSEAGGVAAQAAIRAELDRKTFTRKCKEAKLTGIAGDTASQGG